MALLSATAVQRGFGSDRWEHVSFLTPAERAAVRSGETVVFQGSARAGGSHGTRWRRVHYAGGYGFQPRVATREQVEAAGAVWDLPE